MDLKRFQSHLLVFDGQFCHLADTYSIRKPVLCGKIVLIHRVDHMIDAPTCEECRRVAVNGDSDPPDVSYLRRLNNFVTHLKRKFKPRQPRSR